MTNATDLSLSAFGSFRDDNVSWTHVSILIFLESTDSSDRIRNALRFYQPAALLPL